MEKLYTNWQTRSMFTALTIGGLLFAPTSSAVAQEPWGRGDEWRGQYKTGDKVQFSVSGNASDYQTCTAAENNPQGMMRVDCEAFKQWTAGRYIVYGKDYIRPQQVAQTAKNPQTRNENKTEPEWANGEEWRKEFEVGAEIQFSVSERAADAQTCTVTENDPQGMMRVRCNPFKQWGAGIYIVYSENNIRSTKKEPANEDPQTKIPTKQTGAPSSGLKAGEYACYGSGGRSMIGLAFKVLSGNRYSDLEGKSRGTFVITGDKVRFRGGHLDGQNGRNLRNNSFAIGAQAECEPF